MVTPFDSAEAVAKGQYPIYPIEFMLFDKYDSIGRVNTIKAQTLILVAGKDALVTNENSFRLYNAFRPSKVEMKIFHPFGHNDIQFDNNYYSTMEEFLERESSRILKIHQEVTIDFKKLNTDLSEADILTQYDEIKLICGDEPSPIAERYCYADIDHFNGPNAKLILFSFVNDRLTQMKVDFAPGDSHAILIDRYRKEYGTPSIIYEQKVQLFKWNLRDGILMTSVKNDPEKDMFLWSKHSVDVILVYLGIGIIITIFSLYGEWYWKNKYLKKNSVLENIEQSIQLSIWEKIKRFLVAVLIRVFLFMGIFILITGYLMTIRH